MVYVIITCLIIGVLVKPRTWWEMSLHGDGKVEVVCTEGSYLQNRIRHFADAEFVNAAINIMDSTPEDKRRRRTKTYSSFATFKFTRKQGEELGRRIRAINSRNSNSLENQLLNLRPTGDDK